MTTHELKQKEMRKLNQTITLTAIGDILIHARVYDVAKTEHGYDFTPFFSHVKSYLNDTTITFANQETMIGGTDLGLSTYPAFNSPYEVGDALKDAGVNIVSIANNHTLDRGEKAIQNAIKHWEAIDMMYTGAYKNKTDQERIRVMETEEGVSVAFLAYTYGTNGIPVPKGKDYLVNFINKEIIAGEIAKAKEMADVIVLSLHFGNEYERFPNNEQKDLVQFAADQGVDIVLGHHPHVLQPITWVEGKEGNQMLAVYSLGNFLSGQKGMYRQIGGVFKCTITKTYKNGKPKIEVTAPKFMPTYVKENEWKPKPMFQLTERDLPG
ncbi:CapA family protein [Paracerasibacillus soli]|uniref:CapA family protein n=2 Tax=Paracerasibacillus soli TaxID=480284 RepID=A0ABU5CVN1_9BACI|nr:CapA family protein [Virgibacillus soli]MDY0410433.1 CapA family protein [Virgibacillus soli]